MKNKIANFKVIDSKNNVVIDKYSIKYNTADELKNIIDEFSRFDAHKPKQVTGSVVLLIKIQLYTNRKL